MNKMRYLIYLCVICTFCLSSTSSCARKNPPPEDNSDILVSINIIDRNGLSQTICNPDRLRKFEDVDFFKNQPYQKVLRVYGRDAQGNAQAFITCYYANGQPKQYLEIVNNRAYGTYKEWHANGVLQLEAFIIGGAADIGTASEQTWLFEGCSKAWDENGNLIAEIPYAKGVLEGVSIYYHPNGNVWKNVPFHKNAIEGVFETFLDDGSILQTANYSQDRKEGESIRYWPGCKIAAQEIFCSGELISGSYYNIKGDLITEIKDGNGYRAVFGKEAVIELQEYHQGILEGEIQTFDKNSRLNRISHVKNNVKHGEELIFYDAIGKQKNLPKLSINWYEGKIQGIVKTWYRNGNQESQREMTNNAKNGLATAWYQDGSMMMIEEYDHDKLQRGEYYKKGERIPISLINEGKGLATIFDSEGNFVRKVSYNNGKPEDD